MTRRYMLDTDISSYVIRGTNHALNEKVASNADRICMSAITYHELLYGAKMRNSRRLDSTITVLAELLPIVDFTPNAASQAAHIRATLDKAGKTIGVMDALIAASAMTENRILVTHNIAHFSRIDGLAIEDWANEV